VAYAAGYERRHYTLREATLPVLEEGARPVRVLHVSDLHMTPGQTAKQRWVADLARLEPDLVVNTGDNLAHQRAVPAVMSALAPLLDRPGLFVFGSNDYFAPTPKNPARYLLGMVPALVLVSLLLWYPFAIKTHEGWSLGRPETRSHDYYGRFMYWFSAGLSLHRAHHLHPELTWLELRAHVQPAPSEGGRWLPRRRMEVT